MIEGLRWFLKGFGRLLGDARMRAVLWRMLALLAVMMLALTGGVFWLAGTLAAGFVPAGDAWYVDALAWLAWFFAAALALAVGMVAYVTLAGIAAAPWLEDLAALAGLDEAAESPWWKSMLDSMKHSVMPLLGFAPYALLALALLFVPLIGAAAAGAVWGWGGLRLLAFEFLDAPAARLGWGWRERKAWVDERRWFMLGFAGAASILLLMPVLNLLALPAATVGVSLKLAEERRRENQGSGISDSASSSTN